MGRAHGSGPDRSSPRPFPVILIGLPGSEPRASPPVVPSASICTFVRLPISCNMAVCDCSLAPFRRLGAGRLLVPTASTRRCGRQRCVIASPRASVGGRMGRPLGASAHPHIPMAHQRRLRSGAGSALCICSQTISRMPSEAIPGITPQASRQCGATTCQIAHHMTSSMAASHASLIATEPCSRGLPWRAARRAHALRLRAQGWRKAHSPKAFRLSRSDAAMPNLAVLGIGAFAASGVPGDKTTLRLSLPNGPHIR